MPEAEVARQFGIHPATRRRMMRAGETHAPIRLSARRRGYLIADLDVWWTRRWEEREVQQGRYTSLTGEDVMAGLDRKTFDCRTLARDEAATIREAIVRLSARFDNRIRAKREWQRDGIDILKILRTAPHGTFQIIVGAELPFYSVRHAQQLADAATMLIEALKNEIISSWPDVPVTVCIELAKAKYRDVRADLLPRVLGGEPLKVRDIKAAIRSAEKQSSSEEEAEAPPMREPSEEVIALVRGLRRPEKRLILRLARQGSLDMLVRALDALEFEKDGRPDQAGGNVVRLTDHAAMAIREPPEYAMPASALPDQDDDDGSPTRH